MSQTQNLSTRNALCRITLGLSMVSFGGARLVRNPHCSKGRAMVILGAMKVGEGTVKFCPLKAILQQNGMTGHTGGTMTNKMLNDMNTDGMTVTT
jgi:hypothetical protein